MQIDCDEWRTLGRKCSMQQKRQSGLSWQAERTERESKRDGAMERRCFSALSNNALATSVAEIKSSGAYLDIYPCVTFSL